MVIDQPELLVIHAAGGGDDAIVEATRTAPRPVLVVTSDRALRARVRAVGARVAGAGWFRDRLDATAGGRSRSSGHAEPGPDAR